MESQNDPLDTQLVLVLGTCGMLLLTVAIVLFIYLYQRKLIKRNLEFQKVEDLLRQQELKSAYAMLAGQERAYQQIAEELHDNLGSILVTLNMFASSLGKAPDPQGQKELATKVAEMAKVASDAARKISHSLHSGGLKHFGLATAIGELLEAVNQSSQLQVTSQLDVPPHLDSEVSLQCYRMLQEMINNTLKHAHASEATIEVNQSKGQLHVLFEDNGVGFSPDDPGHKKGLGLKNLEARAERMGGTLTINSQKGRGTSIEIDIPLK